MDFKTSLISHQDLPHVSWLVGLDDRNTDGTLGCEMPLMAVRRTAVKASEVGPVSDWYGLSLKCWCCLMNELWLSHLPPIFMDYGLICCLISYFQSFPQYISISLCPSFLAFCFFLPIPFIHSRYWLGKMPHNLTYFVLLKTKDMRDQDLVCNSSRRPKDQTLIP